MVSLRINDIDIAHFIYILFLFHSYIFSFHPMNCQQLIYFSHFFLRHCYIGQKNFKVLIPSLFPLIIGHKERTEMKLIPLYPFWASFPVELNWWCWQKTYFRSILFLRHPSDRQRLFSIISWSMNIFYNSHKNEILFIRH